MRGAEPPAAAAAHLTRQGIVEGAGRLAVNVGTVALLGCGGLLVIAGRISVGALLAGALRGGCGLGRTAAQSSSWRAPPRASGACPASAC